MRKAFHIKQSNMRFPGKHDISFSKIQITHQQLIDLLIRQISYLASQLYLYRHHTRLWQVYIEKDGPVRYFVAH